MSEQSLGAEIAVCNSRNSWRVLGVDHALCSLAFKKEKKEIFYSYSLELPYIYTYFLTLH